MLSCVHIRGYRGLRNFTLNSLGRVNLLVGANNCGKTSILEAIQILASTGEPRSLLRGVVRRGERLTSPNGRQGRVSLSHDLSHLFYGHEVVPGQEFEISSDQSGALAGVLVRVTDDDGFKGASPSLPFTSDDEVSIGESEWTLNINWYGDDGAFFELPINSLGAVSFDELRHYPRPRSTPNTPVQHISTAGLSVDEVTRMFEDVVLTPDEDLAIEALRLIEPKIERLATVGSDRRSSYSRERGGVVIKMMGSAQRVPIGSMGDGMWRLLGLALALVNAEGGILLVDEIDTGLHFSVMDRMWKLLAEGAEKFSVQVFATTHSRDCYESLSTIARIDVSEGSQVTIQRIESNRTTSVAFTEQEIIAASDRGMEIR